MMQNEPENLPEVITVNRTVPLQGTIEWIGNKSSIVINEGKAHGFPAWVIFPAIGIGLFFILFIILIIMVFVGVYMLFRLLSLPLTGNHPLVTITRRTFKF